MLQFIAQTTSSTSSTGSGGSSNTAIYTAIIGGAFLLAVAIYNRKTAHGLAIRTDDLKNKAAADSQKLEADRQLFIQLKAEFPPDYNIKHIACMDYNFPFHKTWIKLFDEFAANWDNANHEFIDPEIEKLRNALIAQMKDWLTEVQARSVPYETEHFLVPFDANVRTRDQYNILLAQLKGMGGTIRDMHQNLVRVAKQNLRVH